MDTHIIVVELQGCCNLCQLSSILPSNGVLLSDISTRVLFFPTNIERFTAIRMNHFLVKHVRNRIPPVWKCYDVVYFLVNINLSNESWVCRSVVQSISGNVDSSQVTESDLLGWIRLILPAVNLALKKASEVFSGDPATTLKVRSFCCLGDYLLPPLHSAV